MDIELLNYVSIVRRYRDGRRTAAAAEFLRWFPADESSPLLADLLRSHLTAPIRHDWQVLLRDSFDFLISFYSMLEVASIAGAVRELPPGDREAAGRHLGQPDVRRYYTEHYRLALPDLLRERIVGRRSVEEPPEGVALGVGGDASLEIELSPVGLFESFLEVNSRIQGDPQVEMLLWFLDDGVEDGASWSTVLRALVDPERYYDQTLRRVGEQGPVARALSGLPKYVAFCVELDELLKTAAPFPVLQSAMWHFHGYWFERLDDKVGAKTHGRLVEALEQLSGWGERVTGREAFDGESFDRAAFDASVRASVERADVALADLTSGKYRDALLGRAELDAVYDAAGVDSADGVREKIDRIWSALGVEQEFREFVASYGPLGEAFLAAPPASYYGVALSGAGLSPDQASLRVDFAPRFLEVNRAVWSRYILPRLRESYGDDTLRPLGPSDGRE